MKSRLLIHESTLAALDAFLVSPTHALLLSGEKGTGKTELAKYLAAQLLGISLDKLAGYAYCRIIQPEPPAGSITIEAIRGLRSFVGLVVPGHRAFSRVIIIEDADSITREAQHAVLKQLEEPPEGTVLILTSSQPRQLLPTIRSRVQNISVQVPSAEIISKSFEAKGYQPAAVDRATLQAGNNIAQLESLLNHANPDSSVNMLDVVKKALTSELFERLLLVDNTLKDKEMAKDFTNTLVSVAMSSLGNLSAEASASKQAKWQGILVASNLAHGELLKGGNTKLVLTELMLAL